MRTPGRWTRAGNLLAALVISLTYGRLSADTPKVSITAQGNPPVTMEPCPVCTGPATITLTRTGSTDQPLNVALGSGGTATPGVDYIEIPDHVTIPAGKASLDLMLAALDDHLAEGPEVAEISILPVNAAYVEGDQTSVQVVIADDESGAPSERLDIRKPADGATYSSGFPSILLQALAVSTSREIDIPVEFYANGVLVGKSSPLTFGRPPIPMLPRTHEFRWMAPADGTYAITARVPAANDHEQGLESPPVHIRIGPGEAVPVVSIAATAKIAEEDSAPTLRPVILRGEFTVTRTGPTTNAQPVYLHVSGTATPGTDYKALPLLVTIPAGAATTKLTVEAIPDHLAEPLETVIAEVSNCPPDTDPPMGLPCFNFGIDPAHARDTVFIRDDGITRATIEITAPHKGEQFKTGEPITINATAIDIEGAITTVDFYADNLKIGTSRIVFIVAPPPGSPIMHSFTWTDAPAGTHTLTARTALSAAGQVVSPPVTISVGGNAPPKGSITHPAPGAQIPSGTPVEITAAATDADGYVDFAEFFADGHKLGDVHLDFFVAPPPGQTQTFSFTWSDAAPGNHVLSVRFRDDQGATGVSAPVNITVTVSDSLPVITVLAADPFAVEPTTGVPANTATFRLRRSGSVAAALTANFSLGGTATNGVDYTHLSTGATFAAGESTAPVVVEPLADTLNEGRETVILNVEPQFDDGPLRYHVGHLHRAAAVIADASWHPPQPGEIHCSPVGGGLFHLCFPAPQAAVAFRVEASEDFLHWETVHEGAAEDGEVHFVDPDAADLKKRFYRMAEDGDAGP